MPRRQDRPSATNSNNNWSIGSNGLTASGRSELLKDLGRQLQRSYQDVLKEPAPDRIKHLLHELERSGWQEDDAER
ncbi:hypothetical protein GGR34_001602 [Microvirga flocculans]|uniref:Anti-sigma factor NepR domain-containing protein n=1 Tax=Microvirga flocculans TaxID=217168 RepID=A0A7W6IFJ8_9HYPH|nr:NepR family anti-sigma factor [Microvirga flocculans]MBB4039955.1 hypothetical protein [Microvirga flocculans]